MMIQLSKKQAEVLNDAPICLGWSEVKVGQAFYQASESMNEYRFSTIEALINKGLMEKIETRTYDVEFHLTEKGKELINT